MNTNPFDLILIWPISNILIAIYKFFELVHFPFPLAFAIIFLTIIIRGLLWPLTHTQLKSVRKMQELKPHLQRLKELHGQDKIRHQQETAKLYREHGVNPAAGCLPTLIQIPVLIALYQVLLRVLGSNGASSLEKINAIVYHPVLRLEQPLDASFVGLNLAARPAELMKVSLFVILIPVVTGVLQLVLSKMTLPARTTPVQEKPKKIAKEEKADMEKTMEQVQGQMLYLMPAMIAFFSFSFPIGLTLYWNVFTILGIIQQYLIAGFGSLTEWLPKR